MGTENYTVAGTPKRAARKTSHTAKDTSEPPIQMIVRRGANPRFDALKRKTKHLNVQVVWDRREDERRNEAGAIDTERRHQDRRRTPPFTWDVADFVVVVPKSSTTAKRKKKP
jgi:hypothetical protein